MSAVRIGVFGGSFDPIHNGHLVAAESVKNALNLQRVLFVPAGNQWQKQSNTTASDRAEMVRLAVAGHAGFQLSTVDVDRQGPTYTVDTLRDIGNEFPGAQLVFILGTDALAGLASWHNADDALNLAEFVVVTRPGAPLVIPEVATGRVKVVEIPALDLSSTQVRRNLESGQTVSNFLPAAVLRYIEDKNLYRDTK